MSHEFGNITVRNNSLLVNGEALSLKETSPDKLREALELGRRAIISGIEDFYSKTKLANPEATVVRPSVLSMQITDKSTTKQQDARFLSFYGLTNQTNVHRHVIEVKSRLEPYWEATEAAGFTPEIRNRLGGRAMWLALRNPETDPAPVGGLDSLPQALGFLEPGKAVELKPAMREAWIGSDEATYRDLLSKYQELGEERVDQEAGVPGEAPRQLRQIGLIIATANTKLAVQGPGSGDYLDILQEAEEYAYQMHYDELSSVLEAEISRIGN
ncbi:MAG TPA: hypothetical protein VFL81_00310 [Candidatus Saccharimonadales bacterium]|nr:hypothetical protein [Candidatus Saccharimonadales bacterium]